jgi:hypothetical protein
VKLLLRISPVLLAVALLGTTQLSCSVNDYCLNCDNGDGGMGSGDDAGTDGGRMDAAIDAGCIPTGGPEQCDGKDDDCNGLVDDNTEHEGEPCDNLFGACAGGVKVCSGGDLKCNKLPTAETCNGIDDNCSGPIGITNGIDEGDPGGGGKCGTDQGECIAGQFHCNPTTGQIECQNFVDHTGDPELCNAKDDDCDGVIDDNVPSGGNCGPSTDVGACQFGTLNCVGGTPTCQNAIFPKFEICNDIDDDCNGPIDEIFNKNTDIKNCGECNMVCPTRANANTTCTPQGNPLKGTCGYSCKPGFRDINGQAVDGCESGPCFPTGAEECDGQDNDCDGLMDSADPDLVVPNLCLKGGECGGTYTDPNGTNPLGPAPTAQCTGSGGWTCTYPGVVQFPTETRCDSKDNNCEGNVDEFQQNLGATCHEDRENPSTQCADQVDDDGDGRLNDGCPSFAANGAETACDDLLDDDSDGRYNDGCPAVAQRGVCEGTGTYQCDPLNLDGPAFCNITQAGQPKAPNETCDAKDNDCDGGTDEGGANGTLLGQDWIDLGNGRQMMKYEASRPDATASVPGSQSSVVCSKTGVLPWTNVKYQDALAACQSVGAQLCSESQWHHACSVVVGASAFPTYPISFGGTGTYIEAEDYSSMGVGAGAAESGGSCASGNTTDNDADGVVNDGCPIVNTNPETQCNDRADNDADGTVNDGCPAYGPSPESTCNEAPASGGVDNDSDGVINDGCAVNVTAETNCRDGLDDDGDNLINDGCPAVGPAWVPDYTVVGTGTTQKFSGVSALEATPNLGVSLTTAQAPVSGARMDYAIDFTAGGTYTIWVRMFANSTANDTVFVGVNALVPPQQPTSTATAPANNTWTWVSAGNFTVTAGVRYVSVYMGKDGAKVDRIYLVNGATNPGTAETLTTAGNKWAYASSANTYQPNTCNGHDYRQVSLASAMRAGTGVVTVTTSTNHPFIVGDLVQIQGTGNVTFDGTYTVLSAANATTFTYQQSSTSQVSTTGGTATEARDPLQPTGTLTSCYANTGTGAFDMSGNVREWTLAHSPGENPIRGGASNGTADGISCPLNFTLADDTFFFPNIGFRCCR